MTIAHSPQDIRHLSDFPISAEKHIGVGGLEAVKTRIRAPLRVPLKIILRIQAGDFQALKKSIVVNSSVRS